MTLPFGDLNPVGQDGQHALYNDGQSPTDRRRHPSSPSTQSANLNLDRRIVAEHHGHSTRVSQRLEHHSGSLLPLGSTAPFSAAHFRSDIYPSAQPNTSLHVPTGHPPPIHQQPDHSQLPSSEPQLPALSNQEWRQRPAAFTTLPPERQKSTHTAAPVHLRKESTSSNLGSIPNLLGPDRIGALDGIMFSLNMRQQPQAARACGFGDRDRRVIDPPPIVQLSVGSPSMTNDEVRSYLRYESYVMNCYIYDESGTLDASFMPEEYQQQRRLMGSLVGTPFVGQDDHGQEGCFFCFSDLSCRTPGAFRLKFTLVMIDPSRAGVIRHFPVLTEIVSDVFHVYSAKEFPGMLPSSSLAKRLKEQGCIISIKKGNDRSKSLRGQGDLSDDGDGGAA